MSKATNTNWGTGNKKRSARWPQAKASATASAQEVAAGSGLGRQPAAKASPENPQCPLCTTPTPSQRSVKPWVCGPPYLEMLQVHAIASGVLVGAGHQARAHALVRGLGGGLERAKPLEAGAGVGRRGRGGVSGGSGGAVMEASRAGWLEEDGQQAHARLKRAGRFA